MSAISGHESPDIHVCTHREMVYYDVLKIADSVNRSEVIGIQTRCIFMIYPRDAETVPPYYVTYSEVTTASLSCGRSGLLSPTCTLSDG